MHQYVECCHFNVEYVVSRQDKNTDLVDFGARLRAVRREMGLTQADFAGLGGVVMNSQNRYEAGGTAPTFHYLSALAHAGVDVGYLLTANRSAESLDADAQTMLKVCGSLPRPVRTALIDHACSLARALGTKEVRDNAGTVEGKSL